MWQRLFLHQVSGILLARILPSMLLCYHSDPVAVWLRQDQDPKDGAQTLQSQVVVPADPLESGEWQAKSRKMRAEFKMSVNYAPWTGRKDNPPQLRGLPRSKRVVEAVNIAWGARPKSARTFPWWLDVSQCISRCPYGERIPCLTTSTMLYNFQEDCLVSASDNQRLQGWPVDRVPFDCLSEAERSDIAGESMFAADVGTVLLAVFLCSSGPWWKSEGS